MKSTNVTTEQIAALAKILAEHGAELPNPVWLELRLIRLGKRFDMASARRDTAKLKKTIEHFSDLATGIRNTKIAIDRNRDELLKQKVDYAPFWQDDEWHMQENKGVDLIFRSLPPVFTPAEVETTLKVLSHIEGIVSGTLSFHRENLSRRPVRNAKPELNVVISGLVHIWCQAMNIAKRDIKISTSAGSPAMNFIELGSNAFLENVPQRETLERHVRALK